MKTFIVIAKDREEADSIAARENQPLTFKRILTDTPNGKKIFQYKGESLEGETNIPSQVWDKLIMNSQPRFKNQLIQ